MNFSEAVQEIILGRKVRRQEWTDPTIYCLLKDGWLMIYCKSNGEADYAFHQWLINDGDLTGNDWVLLEVN